MGERGDDDFWKNRFSRNSNFIWTNRIEKTNRFREEIPQTHKTQKMELEMVPGEATAFKSGLLNLGSITLRSSTKQTAKVD